MNARFDLSGKTVLVFGGTSGINFGIAEAFASAGASIGVISRHQEKVDAAVESIARFGHPVSGYSLDVRQADAVAAAASAFAEARGAIDVLISGAAGNFVATAASMSANGFKSVIDIDLLGTFNVARGCYPHLRRPGASVINISAPQSMIPMPMQAHVCAAKAGVDMLTRTLAIEWGPEGIRVNAIIPGPITGTEGMARLAPTVQAVQAVADSVPMRRLGTPDDIAEVCLFLASDAARYVSGAILPVDGGWLAAGARWISPSE